MTHNLDGLPEDAEVSLTDSPLKGERFAVSWEDPKENHPTFKAYGDTPEEALDAAREVIREREEMSPEEAKVWQREAHAEEMRDA